MRPPEQTGIEILQELLSFDEGPGIQHYASRPHKDADMHPGNAYDCPACAHRFQTPPLMDKFVHIDGHGNTVT